MSNPKGFISLRLQATFQSRQGPKVLQSPFFVFCFLPHAVWNKSWGQKGVGGALERGRGGGGSGDAAAVLPTLPCAPVPGWAQPPPLALC